MLLKNYLLTILFLFFVYGCAEKEVDTKEEWQPLFNGKDLTGWDIKIKDIPLNENYKNTFRVEDSMIRVSYDQYEKFDDKFGHLYTQSPYSFYKLKFEYRFVGDQVPGAPNWANQNSGIMLHSQSGKSVELHQNFPVSLEFQFLCGNGKDTVSTGNVCTPGTFLTHEGKIFTGHIKNSNSKTYLKNEWVSGIAEVYGDSLIRQIINGDTVLTYTNAMIGEGFVGPQNNWGWANIMDSMIWVNKANTPLSEGYIALQAESQPVDFRRIEILNLVGCMDKKATNYKSYFIKADNSKCTY